MQTNTYVRMGVAAIVACTVFLSGCRRDEFERDAAEVRKSVEVLKDSLREVRGTLTHEGLTSTFVARVDEKQVYLISETFDAGAETKLLKGENQYYLDGPNLMVYESKRVVRDSGPVIGEPKTIDLEFFYNQKGAIVEQHMAVNGSPTAAGQDEINAVKSRFQALYTEVRRQGSL